MERKMSTRKKLVIIALVTFAAGALALVLSMPSVLSDPTSTANGWFKNFNNLSFDHHHCVCYPFCRLGCGYVGDCDIDP